ncbi:MAG: ArsA-related P-loop ATPase, partial [Thermoleophilaceae bacterium]
FVTNPTRTGVVCVALPEEMPVNETLELRRSLAAEMGMELDAVVVNALYPERFSAAEAERIETAPSENASPAVHAALTAALAEHRRAQTQRTQLRRLRREAGDSLPSVTLPFLFERDLGLEAWTRLGLELERSL